MDNSTKSVADIIIKSNKIVVFTGAGISTESGIADFRSPGGIWEKYNPEDFTFQRFTASELAREKYWEMSTEFYNSMKDVQPNPAHNAVFQMENIDKLDCIITQNVDGLHQAAGNSPEKIIELHGTTLTVSCLKCKKSYSRDDIQDRISKGVKVPYCDDCNGPLKPDTISFGQAMPEQKTAEAYSRSGNCDAFIVIGSSLLVEPAASMPRVAKQNKAKLIIINRDPTYHDNMADITLSGSAGKIMTEIINMVKIAS